MTGGWSMTLLYPHYSCSFQGLLKFHRKTTKTFAAGDCPKAPRTDVTIDSISWWSLWTLMAWSKQTHDWMAISGSKKYQANIWYERTYILGSWKSFKSWISCFKPTTEFPGPKRISLDFVSGIFIPHMLHYHSFLRVDGPRRGTEKGQSLPNSPGQSVPNVS